MLAELLEGIARQELAHPSSTVVTLHIVDNDEHRSAEPVVSAAKASAPFAIHYMVEPRRGIAHARNTVIAAALREGADFVALIDDDEIPAVDWLAQLLRAQEGFGADAVYGPVASRFDVPPPRWVTTGRFFERSLVPTGERVDVAATGNVLLTRRLLVNRIPPFDPGFALTGGEDTYFFLALKRDGIPVISCAEAVVVETVPAHRATLRYLVRRAYAAGSAYVAAERRLNHDPRWAIRRGAIGLIRVGGGLITLLIRGPWGKHHAVRGLQRMALGFGMLAGLPGFRVEHYRRPEGS